MEGETDGGINGPALTWGSVMNVESGSSTQRSSHTNPPALRLLDMIASPDEGVHSRDARAVEASSPVEDFSSPAKPSQISEWGESYPSGYVASGGESLPNRVEDDDLEIDGTPSVPRVGTWIVPPIREGGAAQVDIDPNGDDDQVAVQVERLVERERELKRRRIELERPPSSIPSQEGYIASGLAQAVVPRSSTPPSKRQRRGRNEDEPMAPIEKQSALPSNQTPSVNERQSDDSLDLSDLASPTTLLSDPFGDASIHAITRYVKASPLIPNFLKEEIVRCVTMKAGQHSQSQGSKSDSDTQEDGYLKTKSLWIFELFRSNRGKITAGNALTSEVLAADSTMVLHIFSDVLNYGLQMIDRQTLMMSRNEARSNPWFDGNGHPFNVVYQKSAMFHNEASTSVLTQASAEQLSLLQSEIEQLSEERRNAIFAQEQAERRLKEALASSLSTQEDNDFLREQYAEASNMATKLAKSTTQLEEEIVSLKTKLSTGMDSVRAFAQNRIQTLQTQLKVKQGQLHLLTQQNRLTNDAVREKAAKWDAYEAKKRAKEEDLERRKAEVDEERVALYQAMQEEDDRRALEAAKPPHVRFLEVDLNDQKESIEGLEGEREDEVAMLRAEAGESAVDIDVSAPRSSRRRTERLVEYTPNEQHSIAQAIAQTQEQAQAEMADVLQGELAYHHDTSSHSNHID